MYIMNVSRNPVFMPLSNFNEYNASTTHPSFREYKGGRKCPSDEKMKGKVCVITGASSGIGESTAEELSRRGR